jgi:hypothetical protein
MASTVTVVVAGLKPSEHRLLAPVGIPTPHRMPMAFAVRGAPFELTGDTATGQMAALVTPEPGQPVTLTYQFAERGTGYPEAAFVHRDNRFTRAAADLVEDARRIADAKGNGQAGIAAIVNDVAQKFTYGHPETRFNDGLDAIPYISCGLAEGSCVDINTYLIASLRAAGYEAGYVTGYFFPAYKKTWCDDMHCWVVTRHAGAVLEWDIAHHFKMGTSDIRCCLNPKPGRRVAIAHSMGLDFPDLGIREIKLLAEPVWIDEAGNATKADLAIRLQTQDCREDHELLAEVS